MRASLRLRCLQNCSQKPSELRSQKTLPVQYRRADTVGTKITADPEKCFQELTSEKLLIFFLAGWVLFGIIIVSSNFQALLLLQDKITGIGIGLKAMNSSKKVLKITGPALFRINSVIISARTEISRKFSTSSGNTFWAFSGIF